MESAIARALAHLVPGACAEVCDRDELVAFAAGVAGKRDQQALLPYFRNGYGIFSTLEQTVRWRGGTWAQCGHWLDFAAGCGRVTRFLTAAAPGRVAMADIQDYAVAFQRDTLGVDGILSGYEPEALHLAHRYEWISVISLFTHLPQRTFRRWLRRLGDALTEGGTLLVTTHGNPARRKTSHGPLTADAFEFEPISESDNLDKAEYGRTYIGDACMDTEARACGLRVLAHCPAAIGNFQDLWVLTNDESSPPTEPLVIRSQPRFQIDLHRHSTADSTGSGTVEIGGWAVDEMGQPLTRLLLLPADGPPVEATPLERPDLTAEFGPNAIHAGWGARFAGSAQPVAILGWAADGQRGFSASAPATNP